MMEDKIVDKDNVSIVERYKVIDVIKGYGICLMVCGHSGAPFTDWIYLFHMALFFIASGYLWNERNAVTKKNVVQYVKYSLQGTTQGNGLAGGVPPVRFSM